ncbi:hypothetical protein STEG23_006775, partial [Scotinomys teguina]
KLSPFDYSLSESPSDDTTGYSMERLLIANTLFRTVTLLQGESPAKRDSHLSQSTLCVTAVNPNPSLRVCLLIQKLPLKLQGFDEGLAKASDGMSGVLEKAYSRNGDSPSEALLEGSSSGTHLYRRTQLYQALYIWRYIANTSV